MRCFTHFCFIYTESLKIKVYLKLAGINYKSPNVTSTSPIAMPTDPVTLMSPSHHCLPVRDTSNDVNEAAARLLFLSIRWAKSIPSFSHVKFQFICLFKNKIMFSNRFYISSFIEIKVFYWRKPGANFLF